MSIIEDIRAAAHAGDLARIRGRLNKLLAIAYDQTHEAHHYLAQNATPAIREELALRLAHLLKRMPDASGRMTDAATWQVNLPLPASPFITMSFPRDVAHNLWVDVARRQVFALAWVWHAEVADDMTPQGYEDALYEFVDVEYVLRTDNAAEGSRRVAALKAHAGVMSRPSDRFDGLRYHFAHAILTLWLDGILPARLYALTYEAE